QTPCSVYGWAPGKILSGIMSKEEGDEGEEDVITE
ncbi:hypothetical protein A2U01_0070277, partial [Trifolium medium]|nr:hypothetical protein [Trifolium medium]